jgi:hypothetical protein
MDIDELKIENGKLKTRCKRLVLILNETLSYVDDLKQANRLLGKIENIKQDIEEEDKCKMILDEIIKIGNIKDKNIMIEELKRFIYINKIK